MTTGRDDVDVDDDGIESSVGNRLEHRPPGRNLPVSNTVTSSLYCSDDDDSCCARCRVSSCEAQDKPAIPPPRMAIESSLGGGGEEVVSLSY